MRAVMDKTHGRSSTLRMAATAALAMLVCLQASRAQDTQYWNIQYGTRSTLLGGAVIGSVADLSATYYNPQHSGSAERAGSS